MGRPYVPVYGRDDRCLDSRLAALLLSGPSTDWLPDVTTPHGRRPLLRAMVRPERRSLRPLQFAPTEAKFRPSVRTEGLVHRGALVDRLSDGEPRGVVVVTAPPGYGKTVLVSQWAGEDPRAFAWLALDEADNDPRVLTAYIALALHRIQPVHATVLAALAESRREYNPSALLPELARMAAEREPVVLVVDGVEALTDPGAQEVLHVIGTSLSAQSQLVLVGRSAPDLDWSELAL